jgi:putative phage-type endonuclease
MLTASDVHSAMGRNGASARRRILDNKVATIRGTDLAKESSPALDWGVNTEDHIRTRLESKFGVRIFEVGLIKHADHPWLGASIDGITACDTMSDEYGFIAGGTLVEIKAPWVRVIMDGHVPDVYFAQVQVQLACLDLENALYVEYRHCWPHPEQFNIVRIQRDRGWFACHFPEMRAFYDELQCRIARVDDRPKPPRSANKCVSAGFVDGLYNIPIPETARGDQSHQ